jgi:hypothetical protein
MSTLNWQHLRTLGRTDQARRWYPAPEIVEYFGSIRSPSREHPYSYARAAQTKKFARWLIDNRPALADRLGLVQNPAYAIYRAQADNGHGGDITRGGAPLLTYDQWLEA